MDCYPLVDMNYDIFSKELHDRLGGKGIPLHGSFEVTMRCNMRCEHCYLPFSQRSGSRQGELELAEIQQIFDQMAEAGCLWLLLTGGEPFLRKDFLEIYDYAKRKGFLITIFTNGTLLTQEIVDHLAEWRPFAIEISLYGATQETYERVTGIPGSFARCMQGIEMLLEKGLPLSLKSVLLTLNKHELAQMKAFTESLGLQYRFDPVINAGIDGSQYPTQFRLKPEEIIGFEKQDADRCEVWPKYYDDLNDKRFNTDLMYVCGAGRSAFHIDPYGKLSLCISSRDPFIDLRENFFADAWEKIKETILSIKYSQDFSCFGCELRTVCAQCPAMAITEFGDPEARVPFLCNLAHLRKDAFAPTTITLDK